VRLVVICIHRTYHAVFSHQPVTSLLCLYRWYINLSCFVELFCFFHTLLKKIYLRLHIEFLWETLLVTMSVMMTIFNMTDFGMICIYIDTLTCLAGQIFRYIGMTKASV